VRDAEEGNKEVVRVKVLTELGGRRGVFTVGLIRRCGGVGGCGGGGVGVAKSENPMRRGH